MSRHFKDVEFGYAKESELLPVIKKYFYDDSNYRLDENNIFDFIEDNKFIKLKSRHNICSKYATKMIGYSKIQKAVELNKDVCFFFVLMIV